MKDSVTYKVCRTCKQSKRLADFPKDGRSSDGYYSQCKLCKNTLSREHERMLDPDSIVRESLAEKKCSSCGKVKPVQDFYPAKKKTSGYRSQCKVCQTANEQRRLQKHPRIKATYPRMPLWEKHCFGCHQVKSIENFTRDKYSEDGRSRYCKDCRKVQTKRQATNLRERHLWTKYNMTQTQYDVMFEAQGGLCASCGDPPEEGWLLRVDHCHKTNTNRSLLCHHCNVSFGLLKEDPERIRAMLAYAEKWKQ